MANIVSKSFMDIFIYFKHVIYCNVRGHVLSEITPMTFRNPIIFILGIAHLLLYQKVMIY